MKEFHSSLNYSDVIFAYFFFFLFSISKGLVLLVYALIIWINFYYYKSFYYFNNFKSNLLIVHDCELIILSFY